MDELTPTTTTPTSPPLRIKRRIKKQEDDEAIILIPLSLSLSIVHTMAQQYSWCDATIDTTLGMIEKLCFNTYTRTTIYTGVEKMRMLWMYYIMKTIGGGYAAQQQVVSVFERVAKEAG